MKGWVLWHAFEAVIHFITSSIYNLYAPVDHMIFENAFVKLMVDIWGEALKNVAIR